ncbi:MAG TPA: hypothetical protein VHM70_25950 [Polyangiaceae bacterium]|jgi:hypothetical protein|nr:hypothetical protein [Polyangiaceae bacterium]
MDLKRYMNLKHPMQPKTSGILALCFGVLAAGIAVAEASEDDHHGPGHRRPPKEAFEACEELLEGDDCSVSVRDRTLEGTCRKLPDDSDKLACMPKHMGPPPEAVDACQGSTEGDACSVDFHGHHLDGTCRPGPDGQGPLACAPNQ